MPYGLDLMEIRLSLAMLTLLGGVLWGLTPRAPVASLAPQGEPARALSALEDAFSSRHDDIKLARQLAATYERLDQPALVIGVVREVAPQLVADAVLTHRLAHAYEAMGRLDDALATAKLAHARCLRALHSSEAAMIEAPARFDCSAALLVALEQHEAALAQMALWGVSDVQHDSRANLARALALRCARIASNSE
jgi:tetratricopeptide (TPR) repeat protein